MSFKTTFKQKVSAIKKSCLNLCYPYFSSSRFWGVFCLETVKLLEWQIRRKTSDRRNCVRWEEARIKRNQKFLKKNEQIFFLNQLVLLNYVILTFPFVYLYEKTPKKFLIDLKRIITNLNNVFKEHLIVFLPNFLCLLRQKQNLSRFFSPELFIFCKRLIDVVTRLEK
jgi:hypothetical protein